MSNSKLLEECQIILNALVLKDYDTLLKTKRMEKVSSKNLERILSDFEPLDFSSLKIDKNIQIYEQIDDSFTIEIDLYISDERSDLTLILEVTKDNFGNFHGVIEDLRVM